MQLKPNIAKLVTFGRGGDTVHFSKGSSCSGYGSPDNPHAARPDHETTIIPDGTITIDMSAAVETDPGFRMVLAGPMVNVDLEPDQVDRCPELDGSLIGTAMLQSGNGYAPLVAGQILARKAKVDYGPLDHVDVATYVRLWRKAGARIGHYQAGAIVWE